VADGAEQTPGAAPADHRLVITIDGPAAAGKTTVAKAVAAELGAVLFDTGVLYRAVTLAALRSRVRVDDAEGLLRLTQRHHIDVMPASADDGRLYDVLLDGEDVTWAIREAAVDSAVSAVSAHGVVRNALLPVQRRIAGERGPIVMVGRDIGTTVVPDAGTKIFLNASAAERARRRHQELADRGVEADLAELTSDLERRDEQDRSRVTSPLRAADDAIRIETDGHPIESVVGLVRDVVTSTWRRLGVAPAASGSARR
jgi:CMP/dCMP kinase